MIIAQLDSLGDISVTLIGGKAKKLYELNNKGFKVPSGVVITTKAYQDYITETGIATVIDTELGRKSLDTMRWEELWDTSLRIKNHFLNHKIPTKLSDTILKSIGNLLNTPLAVRSSSVKEDSESVSFAGIHESFINISDEVSLMKAIRMVWASLWSDAALLYRKELNLSFSASAMAVIIQKMVIKDVSGVAFGQDPSNLNIEQEIVEAVKGPCEGLVSGNVEPQKWILSKYSGQITKFVSEKDGFRPLLDKRDLACIHSTLRSIEQNFGFEPDIEWTGRGKDFTLLQARPITTCKKNNSDKREWYLSLSLNTDNLKALFEKVTKEIIPSLDKDGCKLAKIEIENTLSNKQLAQEIRFRRKVLEKWRSVYVDELIPFAHGVRAFGSFYNATLYPSDPYEFVKLLSSSETLAAKRNRKLQKLAKAINSKLLQTLLEASSLKNLTLEKLSSALKQDTQEKLFFKKFQQVLFDDFDIVYLGKRLINNPNYVLTEVLKLVDAPNLDNDNINQQVLLEKNYIETLSKETKIYGTDLLNMARLSWQLRDDDNILLSRIESQYLRGLEEGFNRLKKTGQISGSFVSEKDEVTIIDLLLHPNNKGSIKVSKKEKNNRKSTMNIKQRQVNGQPASPGLASGKACIIERAEDLKRFENGNVLVCNAIEPQMTYLVCRAAAVIERRGGMLIHGAIIARELGVPCVNGVVDLDVCNGDFLTVDGYLGIVSVGESTLDLFE